MRTVRELLNQVRWDSGVEAAGVKIEVRVRINGEEQIETIPFEEVSRILRAGIELNGGLFLPYHRLVRVRAAAGVLWPPAVVADDEA